MGNPCGQVNIPQVDNTAEDCVPTAAGCVILEGNYPLIGVSPNTTVEELVASLVDVIRVQNIAISNLKNRVEILENNV